MTTYYVDIDNAYSTAGDGSIGNQFNFAQFLVQYALTGFNTFLLAGTLNGVPGPVQSINITNGGTHIVDAQDVSQPFKIILGNDNAGSDELQLSGYVDWSNGILDTTTNFLDNDASGDILLGDGGSADLFLKGIYACATRFITINNNYLTLLGCTFATNPNTSNAAIDIVSEFPGASPTPRVICINSTISSNAIQINAAAGSLVNSEFTSVVFNLAAIDIGGSESVTYTNAQYSWVPHFTLPKGSANSNDFFEQRLAPDDTLYAITVPATGPFTGYEKGLFGGADRTTEYGIGAFTFPPTYYVNINDAYVTVGDGTIGNQFNYSQFLSSSLIEMGATYLLQGLSTCGGGQLSVPNHYIRMIDAQDVAQPYKFSILNDGGFSNAYQCISGSSTTLKNGIMDGLTNNSGSSDLNISNSSNPPGKTILQNMYLLGKQNITINGKYVEIDGCTLISNNDPSSYIYVYSVNNGAADIPRIKVTNSVIYDPPDADTFYVEDDNSTGPNNVLANNVFSISEATVISGELTGTYDLADNQYSWSPAVSLPTVNSADADFLEQTIAPDGGAHDITASALPPFTGFEKGLFGGADRTISHGIGAFTFGTPTPPVSIPAILAPAWSAGTYATNIVVAYNGAFWISNTSTSAVPGANTTWTEYNNVGQIITFTLNLFNQT